jgi:SRSO17 transposase
MEFLDEAATGRLEDYFERIAGALGDVRRRASFAMYFMGLLSDLERKSVEPIAAHACPDPDEAERAHDRLLNFVVDSTWSDRRMRRLAATEALSAMTAREPVQTWIIDDTGFLKQGTHSVGVQRQYTGSAGKKANCQIGVSLSVCTKTEHVPIDFELYLPECWANDEERRKEARVPDEIGFRTKPELALAMIERAIVDGVPRGVLLADSAYGNSSHFRFQVRCHGLDYSVGVQATTNVWRLDRLQRRRGDPVNVRDLAVQLARKKKKFRRVTWRDGTGAALSSRFARIRVVPVHDDGTDPADRADVWLLIEWPKGERHPTHYFFASLPRDISQKRLVRITKERYRTERVYEDLKGELGLDHYEGRRFPGWHHHVSVVLCCYAFVIAERVRHFPPSARRPDQTAAFPRAA